MMDEGQLRVTKRSRWGSVPERLVEDLRLSLSTRAIAVWLTIKPSGWVVRITVLIHRVGCSKDLWQRRIAPELEAAGYLVRHRVRNEKGQIRWCHEFFPEGDATMTGFSSDGFSGGGFSNDGKASQLDITPVKINQTVKTPPPARTSAEGTRCKTDSVVVNDYIFPPTITTNEQTVILKQLSTSGIPRQNWQTLLDELHGALQAKPIPSPIGYVRGMAKRMANGTFTPERSVKVAEQRAKRKANDEHLFTEQRVLREESKSKPPSPEHLALLPPGLRARLEKSLRP